MTPKPAPVLFQAPLDACSPAELLAYYQARDSVQYFPVVDESLTSRAITDGIVAGQFTFNHETHQLPAGFDWTVNPSSDVEWLILLHKFYYSTGLGLAYHETGDARYVARWVELTSAWIDQVPPDFLSSDVAGRRIQNWIFAHYYFVTQSRSPHVPPQFYQKFLVSLHQQVQWLCEHLTPARNHRTLELYAIFLAAVVFPEMRDAEGWLNFARSELLKNMQSDLLPDGVHCELSTDYHCLVLRNYLAVIRLARVNQILLPAEMDELVLRALDFAMWAHKPDGLIPSLSDGDTGSYLNLLEHGYELYGSPELRYVATQGKGGTPPAQRAKAFAAGGYYVLRSGWGENETAYENEQWLIFDCGPLGAGNHGHLDCLSFELAAYGQSLIVDPGRYTYDESGDSNWRVKFRGTESHNTVLVDGRNQTRYEFHKRKFKIKGPAPDHELKSFVSLPDFAYLHGLARSHEYAAIHERKIFFCAPAYWIVTDLLRAKETHDYELLFHLSAQAQGQTRSEASQAGRRIVAPHLVLAGPADADTTLQIETGYISPTYGVRHPAPVVRLHRRAQNTCFNTVLFPWQLVRPDITVSSIPVLLNGTEVPDHLACALRIHIRHDHQEWIDYYFTAHQPTQSYWQFADFNTSGTLMFVRKNPQGQVLRSYEL